MKMKTGPKIFCLIAVGAVVLFGLKQAAQRGWIPTPGIMKAIVPQKAVLPDVREAQVQNVEPVALPSDSPAHVPATLVRGEIWEWNAQANAIYANGGAATTSGSLMAKHGVNLLLTRQDDTGQMQDDLAACAKELESGASQCSTGANFVIIMGDGAGQFAAGGIAKLKAAGVADTIKVIGATGYSRGEDAFMAPAEIKQNPQTARGLLVAGVLRDGDWNIAQKWLGDNNIPNNPDETTWDADAVNWVNAPDYLKAAEMYNAGFCDKERKVVKDGHPTGAPPKKVCVGGVVTWTPGDVNIAKGKGGIVKIVSSKQYRSQMPAVILGPSKFFQKNRPEIENLLAATFEAGDQMKAFDKALHKAAALSAVVYKDQDEAYWYKYFKGVTERDSQGLSVELGGSAVNNLADELILFGLQPGTNDNFRSTYTLFSNLVLQQYGSLFGNAGTEIGAQASAKPSSKPVIPSATDIEDKSYVTGAQAKINNAGSEADTVEYAANESGPVISSRSYSINFDTGKATLRSDGEQVMRKLKDSIAITGLFVQIDGYTDNTGSEPINQTLSEARAMAVKQWLQRAASSNFPDTRFKVAGHGSQSPVDSNETAEGKSKNRRVQITLSGS